MSAAYIVGWVRSQKNKNNQSVVACTNKKFNHNIQSISLQLATCLFVVTVRLQRSKTKVRNKVRSRQTGKQKTANQAAQRTKGTTHTLKNEKKKRENNIEKNRKKEGEQKKKKEITTERKKNQHKKSGICTSFVYMYQE